MLAISSSGRKALQQRSRTMLLDEKGDAASSTDWPFCLARSLTNVSSLPTSSPRQHRMTVTAVPRSARKSARHGELRGLGNAVVIISVECQRGFRRNENDAANYASACRHVGARQPHARHHIDFEVAAPVLIGISKKSLAS